jgi:assimilatory nitrate reductase catalytic subunit
VLFGREGPFTGVMLRAAGAAAPPAEWLARAEALLGLDATDTLRYADNKRSQHRALRLVAHADGGARLTAYLLAGETVAESWVGTLLQDELPAQAYGRALLAGTASAPVAVPRRSPQVCNCFDISQAQIETVLVGCKGSAADRLATLQQQLECGTNCGSCLPALRHLVAQTPAAPVVIPIQVVA